MTIIATTTPQEMRSFILAQTEEVSPLLCPELRLLLVTERCPLWRAGERELAALGLPDPYWAFCWGGGQALARHLLDHPELVRGCRVLDLGSGGAAEGIAAARAGARQVVAADIDPWAAVAAQLNGRLNGVALETTDRDLLAEPPGDWEVILAGDVCYGVELTARLLPWFRQAARQGARVLFSDLGRGFLPTAELTPVAVYPAPADVVPTGPQLALATIYAL